MNEYDEGIVESKLLEIDELTNGDSFAEYAAILKEPIKYSVITAMPSEVLIVDINDFATLGKDFAESIIKFARSVPEDSELRRALIEMNRWNQYKWAVTKSIKAERYNTVRDFDKQLRNGY